MLTLVFPGNPTRTARERHDGFRKRLRAYIRPLVEGISLGALMESAVLPLRHVSGLESAQPRYRLEGVGLTGLPSLRHSCNLREESVSTQRGGRLIVRQQSPDDPGILVGHGNARSCYS